MTKIIARQVNPSEQDSMFEFESWPNVSFYGNDRFNGRKTELHEEIEGKWPDFVNDMKNIGTSAQWYKNYTECINEFYPRKDGKRYSSKDIKAFKELSVEYRYGEPLLQIFKLVTRKDWEATTLCGGCQGDWIDILYPVDEYGENFKECLEAEYFNTGTEWQIGINGEVEFNVYCHSWRDEDIKQEIRDAVGHGEIELIEFDGGNEAWAV